jgi:hypothetical protein
MIPPNPLRYMTRLVSRRVFFVTHDPGALTFLKSPDAFDLGAGGLFT